MWTGWWGRWPRSSRGAGMAPDGLPLVMLHGWGLHAGIMQPLAQRLAQAGPVTCVDLPGHGGRPFEPPFTGLDELAGAIAQDLPPACCLLGWSLGGMVAARLAAARHPAVRRLVLVSSTPRFVRVEGWEHGLDPALVAEFAAELERDYRGLVRRFLSLQARGDDHQGDLLRTLRAAVFSRGEPDPRALRAGLGILVQADLRTEAGRIVVPTQVLVGQYDRLTPPQAGAWWAGQIPDASFAEIPGAGHAPFLSHPDAVASHLAAFLDVAIRPPGRA
jgi:pimeloyl-[acyl-carrier protein] methyl ester esterase